jgi:Flp pilus assembly pilin Flp
LLREQEETVVSLCWHKRCEAEGALENVAVIGRERSLRSPGMTPAFYVQSCQAEFNDLALNINLEGDKSMQKIKNFINDESGMETLEYAMIAGLIAIVAIAVYGSGSTWGTNLFNRLIAATNAS